jgi:hypothetical protein
VPNTTHPHQPGNELETLARKRAGAKLGWFVHAFVYAVVITGLTLLSLYQGRGWAVFPAAGWGAGLLIHGLAVWLVQPGGRLWQWLLARERAALQHQHGAR